MTSFIDTERGRFHYKVSGNPEGPPLVLVAGLGDDIDSWDGVLPGFADYQCITFDNRGIGGSPITRGPYSIPEMADDAHAVAAALGLTQFPIIGSSMGGAICQEWALRHPNEISHLVLTNTWGATDAFCGVLFEHWIALAEAGESTAVWDSILLFCFCPQYLSENPAVVEEFRALPVPDMRGFAAAAAACRRHDSLSRLGQIQQPTLVIAGRRDILTIPAHSEQLRDAIPGATIEYLDAAHLIFGERPEQWSDLVRGWLAQH